MIIILKVYKCVCFSVSCDEPSGQTQNFQIKVNFSSDLVENTNKGWCFC